MGKEDIVGIDALPVPVRTVHWESYVDGLLKDPRMHQKCHQQPFFSVYVYILWVKQHFGWSARGW
jgi:hypothetical protein